MRLAQIMSAIPALFGIVPTATVEDSGDHKQPCEDSASVYAATPRSLIALDSSRPVKRLCRQQAASQSSSLPAAPDPEMRQHLSVDTPDTLSEMPMLKQQDEECSNAARQILVDHRALAATPAMKCHTPSASSALVSTPLEVARAQAFQPESTGTSSALFSMPATPALPVVSDTELAQLFWDLPTPIPMSCIVRSNAALARSSSYLSDAPSIIIHPTVIPLVHGPFFTTPPALSEDEGTSSESEEASSEIVDAVLVEPAVKPEPPGADSSIDTLAFSLPLERACTIATSLPLSNYQRDVTHQDDLTGMYFQNFL